MDIAFHDIAFHIVAGGFVGLCIGLTGVGGGSLMTPLLLIFGYPAPIAVGTDLLYATFTKMGGLWAHNRKKNINWRLVLTLAAGSIPASMLTILLLKKISENNENYTPILTHTLGVMLVITAFVVLFRQRLRAQISEVAGMQAWIEQHRERLCFVMGLVLGVCVTLSSVGAGAFAAALLMLLYSRLPAVQIIGTDIAHAVPLTLVAGLGYLALGQVDFELLLGLLIGSLPGVALGSRLANKMPESVLRPALATILLLLGLKFIFF